MAFWAVSAHCWVILSFLSTRTLNFCSAGLLSTLSLPSLEIAPTHVQDLALGLIEPHEVCTGPPLKPAQVPLDGIPSRQRGDRTTQLGVVGKLAEDALNPTVHVTDKDVKQHWSQY